jgi:hypothetical protein
VVWAVGVESEDGGGRTNGRNKNRNKNCHHFTTVYGLRCYRQNRVLVCGTVLPVIYLLYDLSPHQFFTGGSVPLTSMLHDGCPTTGAYMTETHNRSFQR